MNVCQCGFEFTEDMVEMGSICPKCCYIPKERRAITRLPEFGETEKVA